MVLFVSSLLSKAVYTPSPEDSCCKSVETSPRKGVEYGKLGQITKIGGSRVRTWLN